MIVWVVWYENGISGVYSSEEAANEDLAQYNDGVYTAYVVEQELLHEFDFYPTMG